LTTRRRALVGPCAGADPADVDRDVSVTGLQRETAITIVAATTTATTTQRLRTAPPL
jgi:hypothetical protein